MGWCGPCSVLEWAGMAQKAYFRMNFDVCQQDLRVGIDVSGKGDARVGTSLALLQGRSSQHLWTGFSNATTAASLLEVRFCQMPAHFFHRPLIFSFKRVRWKINRLFLLVLFLFSAEKLNLFFLAYFRIVYGCLR